MKKSLLFMAFLFILGGLCVNAEELTINFNTTDLGNNSTSYVKTAFDFTKDEVTFNTNQVNPSTGQVKVNGAVTANFYIYNKTALPNIYKIEIKMVSGNAIAAAKSNLVSIRTADAEITDSSLGEDLSSIDNTLLTLVPTAVDKSFFRIDLANIGGTVKFESMTIYYGTAKSPAGLTWKYGDETMSEDAVVDAVLGEEFVAPVLVNGNNLNVSYDSSNKSVATIDENGTIMLAGMGKTVIKAISAETDEYMAGAVSYTLNVSDPSVVISEFVIDVEKTKLNSEASAFTNLVYEQESHSFQFNVINPSTGAARGNQSAVGSNFSFYNTTAFPDITEIVITFKAGSIKGADCTYIQMADEPIATAAAQGENGVYDANAKTLTFKPSELNKSFFRIQFANGSTSGTTTIKDIRIVTSSKLPECPYTREELTPAHAEGAVTLNAEGKAVVEIANGDLEGVTVYYSLPVAPAENAPLRAVSHEGFTEAVLADGVHTFTLENPGVVTYYGYHKDSDIKGVERTLTVKPYDDTTAIDAIGADAAEGEVEFFDIRGVKVNIDNAAPGLYIRRQGTTATKVIVK